MQGQGFAGLRVLSLESRRAREMADLIAKNGGQPVVAPSTQELPIGSNPQVLNFISELLAFQFHCVIFLTGVGTRLLAKEAEAICSPEQFTAALARTTVVARGPKPVAVLRELGVPIAVTVPEPNTWREILEVLDQRSDQIPLTGRRIAVQEYGVPSAELLDGLRQRGAEVIPVRVYRWALPEDVAPLQAAVGALTQHDIGSVHFISATAASFTSGRTDEFAARSHLRLEPGRGRVHRPGHVRGVAGTWHRSRPGTRAPSHGIPGSRDRRASGRSAAEEEACGG